MINIAFVYSRLISFIKSHNNRIGIRCRSFAIFAKSTCFRKTHNLYFHFKPIAYCHLYMMKVSKISFAEYFLIFSLIVCRSISISFRPYGRRRQFGMVYFKRQIKIERLLFFLFYISLWIFVR